MGVAMAPASEVGLTSVKLAVDVVAADVSGAMPARLTCPMTFGVFTGGNRTGIDVESELDDSEDGNKESGAAVAVVAEVVAASGPIIEPLVVCGFDTGIVATGVGVMFIIN